MPIRVRCDGKGFPKLNSYLERIKEICGNNGVLNRYGEAGVRALSQATPRDSGTTAESWSYKIVRGKGYARLDFYNSNVVDGVPVAILLQYGHATKNGAWIMGEDYINPAIQTVFDDIRHDIWNEVTK